MSRGVRAARALTAAAIATLVALGSHVTGGGSVPSLTGVLVPVVLSFAVCWQLAGRMGSWWRTGLAVTASQALFHTLFVVGSGATVTAAGAHAHHLEPGALSAEAAVHGAHGGGVMTLSHLAAAVVTTVLLARVDWALVRAGRAMRSLFAPVLDLGAARALPPVPRTLVAVATPSQAPRPSPVTGGIGLRGPPLTPNGSISLF